MRTSSKKKKHVVDWAALALNDEIGEALRAELLRWPGVELRPMMGTLSYFRGKQMLGCYVNRALFKKTPPKWAPRPEEPAFCWIRLKPESKEKALHRPHVKDSRIKMKTWVEIPLASRAGLEEAVHWFGRSYEEPVPSGSKRRKTASKRAPRR